MSKTFKIVITFVCAFALVAALLPNLEAKHIEKLGYGLAEVLIAVFVVAALLSAFKSK